MEEIGVMQSSHAAVEERDFPVGSGGRALDADDEFWGFSNFGGQPTLGVITVKAFANSSISAA